MTTSKPEASAPPNCAEATGSAFRFRLSAKYPPNSESIGGTFVDGEIKCDVADLPEAALRVLQDLVRDWDMEGQTHIEFTISPNTPPTDA
jgi:hypothetical protein